MKPREKFDVPVEIEEELPAEVPDSFTRAMVSIYNALCNDLGGEDTLSAQKREILRRTAFIHAWCEQMERQIIDHRAGRKDVELYLTACRTAVSLGKTLGFERVQKDVSSDPLEDLP